MSTKAKRTTKLSQAARLMASKRKRSGPAPRPKYRCLDCGADLSSAQVRKHKC